MGLLTAAGGWRGGGTGRKVDGPPRLLLQAPRASALCAWPPSPQLERGLCSSLVSPSVTTVALGPGPRPLGPNSVPCWVIIIQAAGDTCGSLCPVTWGKWSSWSLGSGGDWLLKGEGGYDSQTQQAITCFDLHHGPKLNLATNLS